MKIIIVKTLLYCISSAKRQNFPFRNNPKNLDGSRSLHLFRKGKTRIISFDRTDLVKYSHLRDGKTPSYGRINIVSGSL